MTATRLASDLIVYRIDASRCDLRVGDMVTLGMTIGADAATGEGLVADANGHVEGIHFSGADHALVILLRVAPAALLPKQDGDPEQSAPDAAKPTAASESRAPDPGDTDAPVDEERDDDMAEEAEPVTAEVVAPVEDIFDR